MFIIVLGQHVSILIESFSGPFKNAGPYFWDLTEHFKHSFIKNVSFWDRTAHSKHAK